MHLNLNKLFSIILSSPKEIFETILLLLFLTKTSKFATNHTFTSMLLPLSTQIFRVLKIYEIDSGASWWGRWERRGRIASDAFLGWHSRHMECEKVITFGKAKIKFSVEKFGKNRKLSVATFYGKFHPCREIINNTNIVAISILTRLCGKWCRKCVETYENKIWCQIFYFPQSNWLTYINLI